MIIEELKKQEKMIQKFMKSIVNKLEVDKIDLLPTFDLNLRLQKYDVIKNLENKKFRSPIKYDDD